MSCFDEARALRTVINNNLDDMHRPACRTSSSSSSPAVRTTASTPSSVPTWPPSAPGATTSSVNEAVPGLYSSRITHDLYNDVVEYVPDQGDHVVRHGEAQGARTSRVAHRRRHRPVHRQQELRALHALSERDARRLLPGKDKGVSILIGGKGVLKIGATMGTVIIPFMKLETDEDFEKLNELARNVLDFFAENALDHERTGEMIERIGLINFLEGMNIPIDPNMIREPRSNPYFRSDDWDEQVAKWVEYKRQAA
jgi:dissimilatory sulfite reductase alpha subunit